MMLYPRTNCRAFTLIEVLVSLFIFTIMMMVVTEIFGTAFAGHRATLAVGRDVENTQYALNSLAKQLRTSSVVSTTGGTQSDIQFYDHSQGKCFRYQINGGDLQVASKSATDVSDCNSKNLSSFDTISTGTVTGSFYVIPSGDYDDGTGVPTPTRVGRVTIALEISEDATHFVQMQTTVSLRDFGSIGL